MKYLKPTEVADILSVSPPTVISMCARGELPGSIQVGKGMRWRIPETAISTKAQKPAGPTEQIPKPFDAHAVFERWKNSKPKKPN